MLSRRFVFVVCLSLLGAWLLARTLKDSLFDLARVTNESMLPYLQPGQRVTSEPACALFACSFYGDEFLVQAVRSGQGLCLQTSS
jgi:hypothetical protein